VTTDAHIEARANLARIADIGFACRRPCTAGIAQINGVSINLANVSTVTLDGGAGADLAEVNEALPLRVDAQR
jgi:hypothetical protein